MSAGTERNFPKGSRLGPYEIASSTGAGGMGAMFHARDTRLHRDGGEGVALDETNLNPPSQQIP